MKLTPEQAFAHASALLPIVAITGTSDGYSHGWTVIPKLSYNRKLYTTDNGQCHYIGHDNIQWPAGDIENRIYVPSQKTARYRPFASAAEFMPHADRWLVMKKQSDARGKVTGYGSDGVTVNLLPLCWDGLFEQFTFTDGSPCGVEVLP